MAGEEAFESPGDFSIGGLIRSHNVTHLQFTPSMAAMLLMDEDTRRALKDVRHLFVGGEALQAALVRELRSMTEATIDNMYGPTETTIWSATTVVGEQPDGVVPLGTPIANTQLYVLDHARRPVPAGQPGELFIGGDGVARGYLQRPELTSERFLPNPFTAHGRMYRTGDLVRQDERGAIHFIGRADHQVKVRGYRIELGEIEAHLATHPSIAEAVVVVREDKPNDVRIVAYLRPKDRAASDESLRAHVREKLPDYMMPAHFVSLQRFPLTPNAKVDRSRLPRPADSAALRNDGADTSAARCCGCSGRCAMYRRGVQARSCGRASRHERELLQPGRPLAPGRSSASRPQGQLERGHYDHGYLSLPHRCRPCCTFNQSRRRQIATESRGRSRGGAAESSRVSGRASC